MSSISIHYSFTVVMAICTGCVTYNKIRACLKSVEGSIRHIKHIVKSCQNISDAVAGRPLTPLRFQDNYNTVRGRTVIYFSILVSDASNKPIVVVNSCSTYMYFIN